MAKLTLYPVVKTFEIDNAFKEFLRVCTAKNLTQKTINNYQQNWKYFKQFLEDMDINNLALINNDVILSFIDYLKQKQIKVTSINTILRHIKTVLNYFNKQGYCLLVSIPTLKTQESPKDCYITEELEKLLKRPKNPTFTEFRNWVMVNVLVGTGCRLSTLINLKVEDVDLDNAVIVYRYTKNKKGQIVPIPHKLVGILDEYIKLRNGKPTDYLFPNENNKKFTTAGASHTIARYNKSRGVEKTSVHLFRHTFVKNWILQGGDIIKLQKILGHSSLQMVQHYANLYGGDLKASIDEFSLLENINTGKLKLKK